MFSLLLIHFVRMFETFLESFFEEQEESAKEFDEQFLLEPTETKGNNKLVLVNTRLDYQHRSQDLTELCLYDFTSNFQKKLIDKNDRRLLGVDGIEGKRLCIEGTKMNERHTFASAHPQSSSHILIKLTTPVVPVLLGPQIPRREREETYERYCRALLTLFVPWRSIHDLCSLNQTWSEAFEARKGLIPTSAHKIIENIQLLHECKNDRDDHLRQVILEAQDDSKIDPIFVQNGYEIDQNDSDDDSENILHMISLVNEMTTMASSASLHGNEQRYLYDALEAIDKTERFISLNSEFLVIELQ